MTKHYFSCIITAAGVFCPCLPLLFGLRNHNPNIRPNVPSYITTSDRVENAYRNTKISRRCAKR